MMTLGRAVTVLLVASAVALSSCSKQASGPAGPHFGTFCIQRQDWPNLIALMKRYGATHSLSFHGEVSDTPSGPVFNYYLAQGYSYYFGDGFDLWITSDPFRSGRMDLNGPVKHKPPTPEQIKLGHDFIAEIRSLSSCRVTATE